MNISLPDGMDRWITDKVKLQRQQLLIGLRQLDDGKASRFDDTLVERVKRRGREQLGR